MIRAVTFDFGQTLAELDTVLLAQRLAERSVKCDADALERTVPDGWLAYGAAKSRGDVGRAAWCAFMGRVLVGGGVVAQQAAELADWLFDEQPARNLWRRPVPGMIELVAELRAQGVPVAVLSNSEGRLAALVAELRWSEQLPHVVDSGLLPFEKPDPRIFEHAAALLGVPTSALLHVGDAWEADVRGALGVGATACLFGVEAPVSPLPPRVHVTRDSRELRATLLALGVLASD